MGKSYQDKLRDPRWQRRRLEILSRDQFTCRICKNDRIEVDVHHINYIGEPWDAEDVDLITLCRECHSDEHRWRDTKIQQLLEFLKTKQFTWYDIERLNSLLIYIDSDQLDDLKFCLAYPLTKTMLMEYGKRVKDEHP